MDAKSFSPADKIDKAYGEKLRKAVKNGVEIVVRDTVITTERIKIGPALPVILA
jgi:DNA-binding sugar fermentation-stimulating protein